MRTFILSALAVLSFGLIQTAPASAARGEWSCVGAEFVCGSQSRSVQRAYAPEKKKGNSYAARPQKSRDTESASDRPHKSRNSDVASVKSHSKVARNDDGEDTPVRHKRGSSKGSGDGLGKGSVYQTGQASFYHEPQALASGGRFNPNAMTAAHKTLPFGTKVRVTNQRNGESVVVTINDRGPYAGGRVIDLSAAAAGAISMKNAGVAPVSISVLK